MYPQPSKNENSSHRWRFRGQRPVRIANCSGSRDDSGIHMLRQATLGDVDFVTGDSLAEMNLAQYAEAFAAGTHNGYEPKALEGFQQSIDVLAEKGIKVLTNAGALNPSGLAREIQELVRLRGHSLRVGYVSGDDRLAEVRECLENTRQLPVYLDADNPEIKKVRELEALLDTSRKRVVSAHAYLGARAMIKGLEAGLDIIVCGRVADASPVIAAAWYWYGWTETDYDQLAGSLIAGHLIECSAYVTGANFAGFYDYDLESLIDLPFGIAEVEKDGSCIITKHANTNGMVTAETVKCQFLYELQGDLYLNSDVKANVGDVRITEIGKDRVRVSGIRGAPPPPTTKLAIFYRGGYESQILVNAAGYATDKKWQLFEKQVRFGLKQRDVLGKFDFLEFQVVGTPQENPTSLLKSTTYLRLFAQASTEGPCTALVQTISDFAMQHFSGFHLSLDLRTAFPRKYLGFYPALILQDELEETITYLAMDGGIQEVVGVGHPRQYQPLERRNNYDPDKIAPPIPLSSFGPTKLARLGEIALARSGDKGGNLNIGLFVRNSMSWEWFRSFMTRDQMKELTGQDWDGNFALERVEFPAIYAVHFVVYGILGRGVSSSTKLDALGKAFADYVRDKLVEIPIKFLP